MKNSTKEKLFWPVYHYWNKVEMIGKPFLLAIALPTYWLSMGIHSIVFGLIGLFVKSDLRRDNGS